MVHQIVETDDEVMDDLVTEMTPMKMYTEISPADLDRTYRIGKKKPGKNKTRPIMVKLSRYKVRKKNSDKKESERIHLSITESLTPKHMEILRKARIEHGFTNMWTSDGMILHKSAKDNKVK